jgi:hypothetical protein
MVARAAKPIMMGSFHVRLDTSPPAQLQRHPPPVIGDDVPVRESETTE